MTRCVYACLFLLALGCSSSTQTITIEAPAGATRIEFRILAGECPSEDDLRTGSLCDRAFLHSQSIMTGESLDALPVITVRHAVVVVASGAETWYACHAQDAPGDIRFGEFIQVDDCGPFRSALVDGTCSERCVIDAAGDADGDGLTNCMECMCRTTECSCPPELDASTCVDTDLDEVPNYLDNDSDGDGYSDALECPELRPEDEEGRACGYRSEEERDDLIANERPEDYDDDGIADLVECPREVLDSLCRDTDGDGYADFRDSDSDNDGSPDSMECPDGAGPGMECPDTDGDGTPDYRQVSAPRCDCDDEPSYSCEEGDGVCYQIGLTIGGDGPLLLQWLDVNDEPIDDPRTDLRDSLDSLATLDVPDEAWRCEEPCDPATTVAVAVIGDPDGDPDGSYYLVDLRDSSFAERQSQVPSARLGRFVYSAGGDIVERLTPLP